MHKFRVGVARRFSLEVPRDCAACAFGKELDHQLNWRAKAVTARGVM